MIKNMEEIKRDAILETADLMAAAALTAPKASGRDTIRTAVITGEDKDRLRDKMLKMGEATGQLLYTRDAGNVDSSVAVVLIGCTGRYFGMDKCGMCGFDSCRECRNAGARCVFTVTDLGNNNDVWDSKLLYDAGIELEVGKKYDLTCTPVINKGANSLAVWDPGHIVELKK